MHADTLARVELEVRLHGFRRIMWTERMNHRGS